MPARRKSKKRSRARRPKRRRTGRRFRPILEGFPNSKLVKLRYVQHVVMDPLPAGVVTAEFRANGPQDPYVTGAGSQPMAWDQWDIMYQRYICLGSKMTATWVPVSGANLNPGYFGITTEASAGQLTQKYGSDLDGLLESKTTGKYTPIGGVLATANTQRPITQTFSTKKFFGVANVSDNQNLGAHTNTVPVDKAYFALWLASINGNDPASMTFKVVIDYIVLFQEPQLLGGS